MDLSYGEWVLVLLIAALTIGALVVNYARNDYYSLFSPVSMLSIVFVYYVLAGPLISLNNGETFYRLVEHREYFFAAWLISFIALVSFLLGFNISMSNRPSVRVPLQNFDEMSLQKNGRWLIIISIVFLLIISGTGGLAGRVSFLDPTSGANLGYGGAFRNYFLHGMNFLISACCIFLILGLLGKTSWIYFLLALVLAVAVFTKEGFRFRHILLGYSLFSAFYLFKRKKPSLVLLTAMVLMGITIMGFIRVSRIYGRGLDVSRAEGIAQQELFMEGFGETSTFMTTGFLMEMVPDVYEYIGFDPITQSLAMPIPRVLWPGKPSGDYLRIIEGLYGGGMAGRGVAVLSYGEYYLAFGYAGAVIGYMLLGFFYRRFWDWFKENRENPYAIVL